MRERVNKAKEIEDETPSTSADMERGEPLVDFFEEATPRN